MQTHGKLIQNKNFEVGLIEQISNCCHAALLEPFTLTTLYHSVTFKNTKITTASANSLLVYFSYIKLHFKVLSSWSSSPELQCQFTKHHNVVVLQNTKNILI